DGLVKRGFTRVALWFDAASPEAGESYRRAAALAGYEKEFVIRRRGKYRKIDFDGDGLKDCYAPYDKTPSRNEPAVGLEVLFGAGRAWGDPPGYARFYAGNAPGQFLYDDLASQSLASLPAGPVLRSVGQRRAGLVRGSDSRVRGGTSFWHLDANLSLPVPRWSRPLIPGEIVEAGRKRPGEVDGEVPAGEMVCRDLKTVFKAQVESGKRFAVVALARGTLSDEQREALELDPRTPEERRRLADAEAAFERAKVEARQDVDVLWAEEIRPVTNFIADHADLYSVRPLVLFDAARLGGGGGPDDTNDGTRFAVGGGVQLNVVIARFEAAYLRTVRRFDGDPRGNFVVRLVFRNLF
ncbi:MAG: hypothetical protein ACRD68_07900, partial [Pyrinomonadaceae bacterium]